MNAIIDAAITHSRTALSVLVLVLISGIVAYLTIPKEANPDIDIPIIYVSMTHDGISPEDAERLLVRPMEQKLRTIEGVKKMTATAREGSASVVMEFDAGFDADQAMTDVREQVDLAKPDLPDDTDEPTVNEVNVGLFPVIVVTLAGDIPERALFKIGRDLQDELEALPGVLTADLIGDREELLEVTIDPIRLESYNISQTELINAVTLNNRLVAAGALDTGSGRFSVKVPGLFKSAKDVLELPVKVDGDGVVTLADITTVSRTFKDRTSFARVNGRPAVALEIKKRLGENIISTIAQVRDVVADMQTDWPPGLDVSFIQDESKNIRNMLTDLQNNVLSAILLVLIVVVAALGLRTAGLVGLAIPSSFLFGILVLDSLGLTVNIVVLFALILAVGMLVDGAIVVTEFADRKMAEGQHRQLAYANAAKRMAWPIIASTATTLAAFMPLLFWPGVVGEFMKYLPLTLVVTLIGSLLMALIFVPTLGALIGKPGASDARALQALAMAENGPLDKLPGLTGVYARFLGAIVARPWRIGLVVIVAIGMLFGVQTLYWSKGGGVEFFPDVEPEQSLIHVHARGNLAAEEKDALVQEVEQEILKIGGIETVYARTGGSGEGEEKAEDVVGTIFLEFDDWSVRPSSAELLQSVRNNTDRLAGIYVEPRKPDVGPPTGKDIQIEVRSRFPERIQPVVKLLAAKLRSMDNILDVDDGLPLPGIEWVIDVDRAQAGRFGADITAVGNTVQLITNGIKLGEYRPDDADEEIDIRVRFPLPYRNISQIDQLRVLTDHGLVPIGNFIERTAHPKTGTIHRRDSLRVITVQANVSDDILPDTKVREVKAWLENQTIDPAVTLDFTGADEEQQEAAAFLQKAFGIAIFVMAIILVTQFNSFYHAFLILLAVIMSTVGVMFGLIVTGQTFGIVMTGIGIISLAGIVVNNNIVLIDTYTKLAATMPPLEAVVRTGAQRLRPVLLTTITTIFGLLPMVFQVNIDFFEPSYSIGAPSTQWWVQLATAVAFGLSLATVLTLVVTPSLLAAGAHASRRFGRKQPAASTTSATPAPTAAPPTDLPAT